jgi:hypothetical protein
MRIEGDRQDQACGGNAANPVEAHFLPAQAIDTDRDPLDRIGISRRWRRGLRAGAQARRDARAVRVGPEDRRPARPPSSWRGRCRDFDALLAMAHAICRHELVTLGAADNMRAGVIAGR